MANIEIEKRKNNRGGGWLPWLLGLLILVLVVIFLINYGNNDDDGISDEEETPVTDTLEQDTIDDVEQFDNMEDTVSLDTNLNTTIDR